MMMKKSAHQSSNEVIPTSEAPEDSHRQSSKRGRSRRQTYVRYFQSHPYSRLIHRQESRKDFSQERDFSDSYAHAGSMV